MTSKFKFTILSLFVVFCAVVFFYLTGCSKGGGSGFIAGNLGGNQRAEPKYLDIHVNKDNGSVSRTLAPSGRLSIEALENTFHEDVVIHLVENQAIGNESDIFSISSYIYAIKPDREEKTVKMQTNPLILTFFNEERLEGAENYYVGIKEIGDKEWQFTNVYSSTNMLVGSNGPKGTFEYKLYKDNVLIALFADFNKNIKDKPKVFSMVASMPHNLIEISKDRYNENAVIKLNFIGDNLTGLKADDYRIRVRYANSDNKQVNIRIDGKTAEYISGNSNNKYEAFGKLYAHYFEFVPSPASYSARMTPELSFTLNFKDFLIEDFSSDFIVEAFNNSKNVLPFNCTAMLHFDTKEKEPEPEPEPQPQPEPEPEPEPVIPPTQIAFSISSNNSDLYDSERNLYYLDPSFTLTPSSNYDFSNEEKTKISNAVTVIGADSNIVTKTWNNGSLVVGFSDNLVVNTEYTVKMGEVKDIDGVAITPFADYSFKTMEAISITIVSGESNIIDVPNNLYHCRPQFTINLGYEADNEARTIIAEAVSVTGVDAGNITKNWVNGSLILGFNSNLTTNTEYAVTMSEISGIDRMAFSAFQSFIFKTTADSYIALVPDEGNVFINTPSELYHCSPSFTIIPSIALGDSDKATIAGAIHVSNVADGNLTKNWDENGSLVLGVSQNLAHDTEYTISIDAIGEIAGANLILFQPLTFRTVSALNLAIAPDAANVFVSTPTELYHCRPTFTITPNMSLHDNNRDKIAAAIRVTNVNDSNITREWDNAGNLHIGFSQDLNTDTNYTLSMESVNDITGISVTSFAAQNFTTIKPLTFTVTPDVDNVYEAVSPKYHCRPSFTISPNYDLSYLTVASKSLLLDSVSVSNSSGLTKAWDGNNIRVTFSSNQTSGDHSLTMATVNGLAGITVTPFVNYDFSILDTLAFTVTPATGNVYTALSPKYQCRPEFTITTNFNLNAEDQTKISNAISVSNVSANKITKSWSNANTLNISFTENLNSDTTYTLTMGSVTGMDNVNINSFSNQTFTTIPQLAFDITSANDNVFYGNKYHCNPTFTITPSFTVSSGDKSTIEAALSVSGVNNNNLSKSWNGNNLLLGFNNNIATSTDFTISMANINSLTDVNVTGFDDFDFSTIPDLIVTLATSSTTLVKKAASTTVLLANGKNFCYCSDSSFTISTNMTLNDANKAKLFAAVSLTGIDSTLVNKSWNGEKIAISFNDTLAASTSYSIQMSAISDINGVTVRAFPAYPITSFYHLGKGTESDPFTIYTPAQLACLDLYPGEAYYYKQMEDLDLSVYDNWKPIGSSTEKLRFWGSYNGNNKTISNAVINHSTDNHVGLFCYTDRSLSTHGSIENLTLENFTVNGKTGVGALAGYAMRCELKNISVRNSSVTGDAEVGGVAGYSVTNYSKVLNVTAENLNVTGRNDVAGLFGFNQNNTKENCGVINSNITATGGTCGGVFAYSTNYTEKSKNCFIRNSVIRAKGYCGCYAGLLTNNVSANYLFEDCSVENCRIFREDQGNYTSGFIGIDDSRSSATYQSCNVASVTISSTGSYVGGFAGSFKGLSLNSCNVASISMDTSGNYIGGLVGYNEGSITSCYSEKVKILAKSHSVGGLVGYLFDSGSVSSSYVKEVNIKVDDITKNRQCYGGLIGQSAGEVSLSYVEKSSIESFQQVGGLVGYCTGGSIRRCFAKNTDVKGYDIGIGGLSARVYPFIKVDSCYLKNCNTICTVEADALNHTISGFIASNSGHITNCYTYNSTVTGKENYGAIVGQNGPVGQETILSDCFISQDHSYFVDDNMNSAALQAYYNNVADLDTFKSKIWSDGKTIEEGSTAWANYNTTSFPPQLAELPEP